MIWIRKKNRRLSILFWLKIEKDLLFLFFIMIYISFYYFCFEVWNKVSEVEEICGHLSYYRNCGNSVALNTMKRLHGHIRKEQNENNKKKIEAAVTKHYNNNNKWKKTKKNHHLYVEHAWKFLSSNVLHNSFQNALVQCIRPLNPILSINHWWQTNKQQERDQHITTTKKTLNKKRNKTTTK